jgi:hypothetical protein
MAERKSGPVKPPVIDLKARDATETPAEQPAGEGPTLPLDEPVPAAATPDTVPAVPPRVKAPKTSKAAAAPPEGAVIADPIATEEGRAAAEGIPLPGDTSAATPEPAAPVASQSVPPPPEPPRPEPEPHEAATIPPPMPPRPPARLAMPWSAISIAAVAGAILGAGLTYAVSNWIALPQQAPAFEDPTPALGTLTDRIDGLDSRFAALEETTLDTRVSLDATLVQLDTVTTELRQSIADLGASIPAPQPATDLTAIEAELQTLESRVAAIAAGASSADASALAENLVGIEQSLATLNSRLADFDSQIAENGSAITTLRADIEGAKAAIAAQTRTLGGADIGPAVKLPLIVSGLEAAFASGRPYTTELSGLVALLPDLAVPEVITTAAPTGLARPDALADRFDAVLPDIIAGRTGESTGDWAQDAVEWAKALLALRPGEEMEGDTPEAIVSRLEGAVERRDFIAAAALLAQLPAPMRQAAGEVGTDIAAHAQAETFVTSLRTEALAPAAEPAN